MRGFKDRGIISQKNRAAIPIHACLVAVLLISGWSTTANAAVIGSYDTFRTFVDFQLTGGRFDTIRNDAIADGHNIAISTDIVTSDYLNSIDVFFTGGFKLNGTPNGLVSPMEISAFQDWVSAGGILFSLGDNVAFADNYNALLNPFGIGIGPQIASGGVWGNSLNPLLDNILAGSDLGFVGSGLVTNDLGSPAYESLASIAGGDGVAVLQFGAGLVIAAADVNFIEDLRIDQNGRQFVRNVFNAQPVSAVPLPAALPLFAGGLGLMGWFGRRKKHPVIC